MDGTERFLDKVLMPALPLLFVDATSTDFSIGDDGKQVSNNKRLHVQPLEVQPNVVVNPKCTQVDLCALECLFFFARERLPLSAARNEEVELAPSHNGEALLDGLGLAPRPGVHLPSARLVPIARPAKTEPNVLSLVCWKTTGRSLRPPGLVHRDGARAVVHLDRPLGERDAPATRFHPLEHG
jgi:hypothetical protein